MDKSYDILLSRRQAMLAGATLSLAMTVPVFASETSTELQTEGMIPMTENFITTKDGVEIFYRDWARSAGPTPGHVTELFWSYVSAAGIKNSMACVSVERRVVGPYPPKGRVARRQAIGMPRL
ncbi:hypothetical protein J2858_004506 [Neorhizobium galegae]|nr:hypothetical protein [Neorhizobium galegae]